MDFGLVDSLVCSLSATAPSNNGGSLASETDADLRLYGSAFLNKEYTDTEHDLPVAKLAKVSSCGGEVAKVSLQECNNGGGLTQPQHQMLSFSTHHAPPAAFPFVRSSSGYGHTIMHGVRGPFTPSQWMELEHQVLIYKHITANVPIPSYLLNPIRKALQHSGFSCFSLLRSNALGWGGFDKGDPEPGRCRRTDGKKWRCSRDAVADQKYCERHINRGRQRSRKPVEGGATTNNHTSANRCPRDKETPKTCLKDNQQNAAAAYSLLNPLDRTELSMGLGVGAVYSEESQRHKSWGGGPLGEALHTTTSSSPGQCKERSTSYRPPH